MIKNRREFIFNSLQNLTFLLLTNIFLFKRLKSSVKPRIVIIGLGIGGLTCLKYLNKISSVIDIVVIEKERKYRTGPFSNLVIGGIIEESDITFKINKNKFRNIKFIYDEVFLIDSKKKIIKIDKQKINYDFLILSPGIGYKDENIEGYQISDKKNVPHCWDGESNLLEFKNRLDSLKNNSTIIISSPDYPYRCPPAPYERASLIANYFKKKKINVKILILDSKDSFTKKENFLDEWKINYKNTIDWIPRSEGGKVVSFNQKDKYVRNEDGQIFKGDFIHIIPEQKSAKIFSDSNLLEPDKDWCQINPVTFEIGDHKDIYAVGDSINAWDMPKSAFSANSQAKVLAINLINKILDKEFINPVFLNTCYSFSNENRAFSISAWYRLNGEQDRIVSLGSSESKMSSSSEERKEETRQAFGWYENMVNDLFL